MAPPRNHWSAGSSAPARRPQAWNTSCPNLIRCRWCTARPGHTTTPRVGWRQRWGRRLATHLTQVTGQPIACYDGSLARGARDHLVTEFQDGTGPWTMIAVSKSGYLYAVENGDHLANYTVVINTGTLTVTQATPVVTWNNPAAIRAKGRLLRFIRSSS